MLSQPRGGDLVYAHRTPLPELSKPDKSTARKSKEEKQRKMVRMPGTMDTFFWKDPQGNSEAVRLKKY